MDVIDRKNCPVCGTPVVIVSGDEGTSHYEPVRDFANEAKIEKLEAEVERLHGLLKKKKE